MIRNIVPQSHLTIRDLRQTFRMQLDKSNYNDSTIAKLLGHSDHRSVHRYKRGKDILREAVNSLEKQNPATRQKRKSTCSRKCLKIKDGDEGDRTPDLCNAIAALSQLSYVPLFSMRRVENSSRCRIENIAICSG